MRRGEEKRVVQSTADMYATKRALLISCCLIVLQSGPALSKSIEKPKAGEFFLTTIATAIVFCCLWLVVNLMGIQY